MTTVGFEHLPGRPLRPGTIAIPAAERKLLADALRGPLPEGGELHPLHAFIAAQRGVGESIQDLCQMADFSVDDGPMMGSIDMDLRQPLLPDTEYRIEGEVVDIVRKSGRARGEFDLFTYRERVITPEGDVAAEITNTFVLFRRDSDAQ